MNELALFAGAGGGILGGKLLGWRTVCAVERDAYAAQVLAQRQNDGILEPFPIWSDVCSFDGRPWRGIVDIVSGGFPCQDISAAGKGAGIDGERSGLWSEFARIISEIRPRFVFVENSPMLTFRGLGRVLGDLAALGYDAEWCVLGAVDAGAPHKRERIWILAHTTREGGNQWGLPIRSGEPLETTPDPQGCREEVAYTPGDGRQERRSELQGIEGRPSVIGSGPCLPDAMREGLPKPEQASLLRARGWKERGTTREFHRALSDSDSHEHEGQPYEGLRQGQGQGAEVILPDPDSVNGRAGTGGQHGAETDDCGWWATEPAMGRVAHGVAYRVDRLKAIGNGQVPQVAELAFRTLYGRLIEAT
jgi:DNA (cytosine-5)-methyltransferase 1